MTSATTVIPAKAGIHIGECRSFISQTEDMNSRLRGNDGGML